MGGRPDFRLADSVAEPFPTQQKDGLAGMKRVSSIKVVSGFFGVLVFWLVAVFGTCSCGRTESPGAVTSFSYDSLPDHSIRKPGVEVFTRGLKFSVIGCNGAGLVLKADERTIILLNGAYSQVGEFVAFEVAKAEENNFHLKGLRYQSPVYFWPECSDVFCSNCENGTPLRFLSGVVLVERVNKVDGKWTDDVENYFAVSLDHVKAVTLDGDTLELQDMWRQFADVAVVPG